jgi:hypothetical protein
VTAEGRLVVPEDYVLCLGSGKVDRGRRLLERLIADLRARRLLRAARQPAL